MNVHEADTPFTAIEQRATIATKNHQLPFFTVFSCLALDRPPIDGTVKRSPSKGFRGMHGSYVVRCLMNS